VAASLISIAALTGFFVIGAVVACYAMAARVFPPLLRATGTGVALGVGRLGGTLGPYVAGLFLAAGWSRMDVSVILTVPMLAAAAIIALVPLQGPGDVPPPLPLRSRRSALR
jgi:MFS family permease